MIVDSQGLFSESQVITADHLSDNVIDTGVTSPKPGSWPASFGLWLNIEAVTTTTGLIVRVETDSTAAHDATPTVHAAVTLPAVTVGRYFLGSFGPFGSMERYLGLYYDVTTTGSITVSAGLCMVPQTN